jgi:serine phosphatase RsbU (regulator of sigma subunit)
MNPAHVRKVAGSKPSRPAAAHTPGAPIAAAPTVTGTAVTSAAVIPGAAESPESAVSRQAVAAAAGRPAPAREAAVRPTARQVPDGERPGRGSPEHALAVQDRLATWVCDLSLLQELTERLARTDGLDDTLREVLRAGASLVGAGRGLAVLAPGDDPGPGLGATVGLGLGHAELGALETVGFGGVPPDADEVLHPDLRLGPAMDARQREVAAQLGLGAGYGLALVAEGTGSAPDPCEAATYGAAGSSPAAAPGPPAAADLCDFSTSGGAPSPSPGPDPEAAAGRRRLGALVWFYDDPARPTSRQRRLAGMYLRYAAAHVSRCLDLAHARRAAAELTSELLPARLPRVPGVRMAVRHRTGPLGGGDWYDALPLPEGALGLAVGGVTGAGPSAVAARDRLRASLRAYAVMEGEDPVAVLSDLELLLRLTEPARSATALFGHVCAPHPSGGRRVTLAGAGHCPPLLVGDHRCEYVETSLSAPLNMLACWEAPSVELHLRAGESLVFFTDGLPHRTGDTADRAFARVHAAAQSAPASVRAEPGRLADHLLEAVLPGGQDATGGAEDLVLLVARFD